MDDQTDLCAVCDRVIPIGEGYIVRIDVFADPSVPPIDTSSKEWAAGNSIEAIIQQLEHTSAEDAQDSVHRRFEYRLCPSCQRAYLANPLGMPRRLKIGVN